jgi:hypothetical protein
VIKKYFIDLRLNFFAYFVGQNNNRNEKQIATIAANLLIIVAAVWAGSAT